MRALYITLKDWAMGGYRKVTARDLRFEVSALAAASRGNWNRARVLPPCAVVRRCHAGRRGDRIKTPWGLVGREWGGVRVQAPGWVVHFTEEPSRFRGR